LLFQKKSEEIFVDSFADPFQLAYQHLKVAVFPEDNI